MKKSKFTIHLFYLLIFLFTCQVFASEYKRNLDLNIYNTFTDLPEQWEITNLSKRTFFLSSYDIYVMNAHSLRDILMSVPGVFVALNDRFSYEIAISGLYRSSRVKVIWDGVGINDPFDGSVDLNIPAWLIHSVTVFYSPSGTWYGEGSILATVVVKTKRRETVSVFHSLSNDLSQSHGFFIKRKSKKISGGAYVNFTQKNFPSLLILHAGVNSKLKLSPNDKVFLKINANGKKSLADLPADFNIKVQDKNILNASANLYKQSGNRKLIDVFYKNSIFSYDDILLSSTDDFISYNAMKNEFGFKSHLVPFASHDLFLGVGGEINGVVNNKSGLFDQVKYCPLSKIGVEGMQTCNAHAYAFLQDEWRIRPPLIAIMGARVAYPMEKKSFKFHFLPSLGLIIMPYERWYVKLGCHTSWRYPTIMEKQKDILDNKVKNSFASLPFYYEKSRNIEVIVGFSNKYAEIFYSHDFSFALGKIDNAIDINDEQKSSFDNEVDIIGGSYNGKIKLLDRHELSWGLFYYLSYFKSFDDDGYAICNAGAFNILSNRAKCKMNTLMPNLLGNFSAMFDLKSSGNFFTSLNVYKNDMAAGDNTIFAFNISYATKPIFKNLWLSLSVKDIFGSSERLIKKSLDSLSRLGVGGGAKIILTIQNSI